MTLPQPDGALTRAETGRFVAATLGVQTVDLTRRVLALLRGTGNTMLLTDGRPPPDSRLAHDLLELATTVYSPSMLGHGLRCWHWADLFAQRDQIAYDPELLFAACLLHDLALPGHDVPTHCFAVHSGRLAHERLLEQGTSNDFADRVADAITLHMDPRVPPRRGTEAHLSPEPAPARSPRRTSITSSAVTREKASPLSSSST